MTVAPSASAAVMRAQTAGEQAVAVGFWMISPRAGRRRQSCASSRLSRPPIPAACRPPRWACRSCRWRRAGARCPSSGWQTARTDKCRASPSSRERQFGDILQRPHVGRVRPRSSIRWRNRHVIIGPRDHALEPLQLQVPQLLERQKIRRADGMKGAAFWMECFLMVFCPRVGRPVRASGIWRPLGLWRRLPWLARPSRNACRLAAKYFGAKAA